MSSMKTNRSLNYDCEMNVIFASVEKWCPGWESNPHEEKSPEDFKSSASAIPPPGRWQCKSNKDKPLLQHSHLHCRPLKHCGVGSGVSWSLCRGIQPLHDCQRVLRGKVRVPHSH